MHMDTRINLGAEENVPFENESVQFWKVFFDFGYWLLLNPFRFTFNVVTGNYEVQTNYLQKVRSSHSAVCSAYSVTLRVNGLMCN